MASGVPEALGVLRSDDPYSDDEGWAANPTIPDISSTEPERRRCRADRFYY